MMKFRRTPSEGLPDENKLRAELNQQHILSNPPKAYRSPYLYLKNVNS